MSATTHKGPAAGGKPTKPVERRDSFKNRPGTSPTPLQISSQTSSSSYGFRRAKTKPAKPANKIVRLDMEQDRILKEPSKKKPNFWKKTTQTIQQPRSPGLELLRKTKFLFVRVSNDESSFLKGSVRKFDVFDETGARIYLVKEMEGDGQKFSLGGRFNVVLCVLACGDGRELMRIEGNRAKNGEIGTGLSVFIGPLFVGDIVVKRGLCSSPLFLIVDDSQKEIAVIKRTKDPGGDGTFQHTPAGRTCCSWCCGTSFKDPNEFYDIFIPETRSRIGSMGRIARFFSAVDKDLVGSFGVELSDAMSNKEKAMLLAAIFVMDRPLLTSSSIDKGKPGSGTSLRTSKSLKSTVSKPLPPTEEKGKETKEKEVKEVKKEVTSVKSSGVPMATKKNTVKKPGTGNVVAKNQGDGAGIK